MFNSEVSTFTVTEPVTKLDVSADRAGVNVRGSDRSDVSVTMTVERLVGRMPTVSHEVTGGVLAVEARFPKLSYGSLRLDIEVPAALALRVRVAAGGCDVRDTTGPCDLDTHAGGLSLRRLAGPLKAETNAGGIQGKALRSTSVEVRSHAGGISLEFDSPPEVVDAATSAGGIELVLPDEGYAVDARTRAGGTKVDVRQDPAATHKIRARTQAGGILIKRGVRFL